MTQQQINEIRKTLVHYIDERFLRNAIKTLIKVAHDEKAYYIEEKAKQIDETYTYMLRYLAQGIQDPQRQDIYDNIVNDLYTLSDHLISDLEKSENPSLYYSKIRYMMKASHLPLQMLLNQHAKLSADNSLFNLVINSDNPNAKKNQEQLERTESDIFTYIWCTQQLSQSDADQLSQVLEDVSISNNLKRLIVSAIWMSLMQFYDKRKLRLLMTTYLKATDINVSSVALIGMLISLWRYRNRPLTTKLHNILLAVKDKPTWPRDLRIAYVELIRARDTERINRKMREEVIPKMQKITPNMIDKINKANLDSDDPMSLQENPEWQDMLEKSGVADQLKELTEIQMEGGDVMMSTFSHLKGFPFFNEISNWFVPFNANNTGVSEVISQLDIIGDMMENAHFLCDSDKYSFLMSLKSVPVSQRDLMVSQMKAQSEHIYEMMNRINVTEDTPESRRLAVNHYIQDIYRFFKLFYRKAEFFDPFGGSIDLYEVPSLADDFENVELLQIIAEFYFKIQYIEDAIKVYKLLDKLEEPNSSRYQKMGYCFEKMHQYQQAIIYYQRAELLDNISIWTLRRLANCYRAIGDKSSALSYYKRLSEAEPENMNIALLYAQSLIENDHMDKALKQLYMIEFLDEKNSKVWRPLAWALFVTGDFDGAEKYYQKILDDAPQRSDYLNMGYVAIAKGDITKAVQLYSIPIQELSSDISVKWLSDAFESDKEDLQKAGIDIRILPLIVEIVKEMKEK